MEEYEKKKQISERRAVTKWHEKEIARAVENERLRIAEELYQEAKEEDIQLTISDGANLPYAAAMHMYGKVILRRLANDLVLSIMQLPED
jgi:hypothetical protein